MSREFQKYRTQYPHIHAWNCVGLLGKKRRHLGFGGFPQVSSASFGAPTRVTGTNFKDEVFGSTDGCVVGLIAFLDPRPACSCCHCLLSRLVPTASSLLSARPWARRSGYGPQCVLLVLGDSLSTRQRGRLCSATMDRISTIWRCNGSSLQPVGGALVSSRWSRGVPHAERSTDPPTTRTAGAATFIPELYCPPLLMG